MKKKILIATFVLFIGVLFSAYFAKNVKAVGVTCDGAHACTSALDICHLTDCSVWGGWTELPEQQ